MDDVDVSLSDIPKELHNLVLEKMIYQDFAKFNTCSQFSAKICLNLSPQIKLQIDAFRVDVTKKQVFLTNKLYLEGSSVPIEDIPINLNLDTRTVDVNIKKHASDDSFNFFKRHSVKTTRIVMNGCLNDDDLDFAQFLLNKTGAEEWVSRYRTGKCDSEAFFYLPEVQNLRQIYCGVHFSITNDILQKLQISNIYVFPTNAGWSSEVINENGISKFLMQWVRKKRRIEQFALPSLETFDLESICAKIETTTSNIKIFRKQGNSEANKYWICRKEDNHDQCLWLQFEYGRLEINACGTTELCPGV